MLKQKAETEKAKTQKKETEKLKSRKKTSSWCCIQTSKR